MEVLWHGEACDAAAKEFRLIMDDDGLMVFQRSSADEPEWVDVDEGDERGIRDFQFG